MRLLIIEDHPLARLGIRLLIQEVWPAATVDEAIQLSQAMQYLSTYQYDLIILDPGLPDGGSGTAATERITSSCPGTPVVVLSGSDHPGALKEALEAGATAFLPKRISVEEFRDAIAALTGIQGELQSTPGSSGSRPIYAPPQPIAPPADDRDISVSRDTGERNNVFSPRQSDILPLLCVGKSNKEIARALGLTENTVKQHMREIMRRLKTRNRTEAAIAARALQDSRSGSGNIQKICANPLPESTADNSLKRD